MDIFLIDRKSREATNRHLRNSRLVFWGCAAFGIVDIILAFTLQTRGTKMFAIWFGSLGLFLMAVAMFFIGFLYISSYRSYRKIEDGALSSSTIKESENGTVQELPTALIYRNHLHFHEAVVLLSDGRKTTYLWEQSLNASFEVGKSYAFRTYQNVIISYRSLDV